MTPAPIAPVRITNFWDTLHTFENQTLWKYFCCDGDVHWIEQGIIAGTLIQMSTMARARGCHIFAKMFVQQDLSFIALSLATHRLVQWPEKDAADRYQGEIQFGVLIQLVLRAATQRVYLPFKNVTVNCDNKGVVIHGNNAFRPLHKKQEQANVLWCMKQYIQENPFEVKYEWGKVHQDDAKT